GRHGESGGGGNQQEKEHPGHQRGGFARGENQDDNTKQCEPSSNGCRDRVLVHAGKLQIPIPPALRQLKRARLVTRDLQIGRGFRMMSLQGERSLVIQNRTAKIASPEISIAQIIKQICAPLPRPNECLVTGDRFREMALRIFLVCLCEVCIWLRESRAGQYPAEKKRNAKDERLHFKF